MRLLSPRAVALFAHSGCFARPPPTAGRSRPFAGPAVAFLQRETCERRSGKHPPPSRRPFPGIFALHPDLPSGAASMSAQAGNAGGGPPTDDAVVRDVSIKLTPSEERLFDVMTAAAESYERGDLSVDESQSNLKFRKKDERDEGPSDREAPRERIEIRVAGGWVRDKILGMESSDVDVALDNVSGVRFASIVQEYLLKLERDGTIPAPKKRHRICVISANPDQFKRLETATMKVFDGELDFVHLRPPEGAGRDFGSPREDALLRDFTANALFYNVRTRRVEDWTGRGADDLLGRGEAGRRVIATPLDASETFCDDPLRALRAVRFAVRLDADLSDGVRSAVMKNEEVRRKLQGEGRGSVSRERVGKELEGMLSGAGAKPGCALSMLIELDLAPLVFPLPQGAGLGDIEEGQYWMKASDHVQALADAIKYYNQGEGLANDSKTPAFQPLVKSAEMRLLHLSTCLSPFRDLSYEFKKERYQTVVTYMIKEGIKFKNKDEAAISKLLGNVESMRSLLRALGRQLAGTGEHPMEDKLTDTLPSLLPPVETGMLLRKVKELWPTCLILASVLEIRAVAGGGDTTAGGFGTVQDVLRTSGEFHRAVIRQGLDNAWKLRPLLDGRAVVSTLGLGKPGPMVQVYIEEQIKWILLHPDGTKDDCELHLRKVQKERDAAPMR
uniref:Poly A polymerase head domain-containing protein n=1 Tax=Odontella aurita TaxID=265563 RepID=A0A6U6K615_9STRA|mmetsp:Transcript_5995/g.17432  ORF Transcript_5995/g.17432 Transcript_5995/m.17432 type:complete len:673 (+) Transcript_5995:203-2221(+)